MNDINNDLSIFIKTLIIKDIHFQYVSHEIAITTVTLKAERNVNRCGMKKKFSREHYIFSR